MVAKVEHFAAKDAMDIEGLSEKTAELMYNKLGLRECSQLYSFTAEDLGRLEGFKTKKINNILGAIKKSKVIPLERFLFALGIDGVGKVAAKDLAKAFKSVQNLSSASAEELLALEDIGEITAEAIVNWFKDEKNVKEIDALFAVGVKPTTVEKPVISSIFAGQLVVLTGTLQNFKRSQAQKIIEENGGECQSSVTAKTTLVIAGEAAGSKLDKAQKLGIKIIDEAEFENLING